MNVGLEFEAGEGRRRAARAYRGGHRQAADPGPGRRAALRDGRRAPDPSRAAWARAADRFRGQPLDRGTYMVEGGGSKNFQHIKGMLYARAARAAPAARRDRPRDARVPECAGPRAAQALMIFDTWGGVLTPADYREFSLRYHAGRSSTASRREKAERRAPRAGDPVHEGRRCLACGHGGDRLRRARRRLDDGPRRRTARPSATGRAAGQPRPSVLYAPPARSAHRSRAFWPASAGPRPRLQPGARHPSGRAPAHAAAMVDAVHELSPQYHEGD